MATETQNNPEYDAEQEGCRVAFAAVAKQITIQLRVKPSIIHPVLLLPAYLSVLPEGPMAGLPDSW